MVCRKLGMRRKMDNMPSSAVIYLILTLLGYLLHDNAGFIGDYLCKPYITFLKTLNQLLDKFQISTITYFT